MQTLNGKSIARGTIAAPITAKTEFVCTRCGYSRPSNQRPFVGGICPSCSALATADKPLRTVHYRVNGQRLTCTPWRGKFDLQDHPMQDGIADTRPRSCGHSDCVTKTHIVEANGAQAA